MSTPHKAIAPGTQGSCPTNVVAFTDYPVTANVTLIRKTHIDELRASVNAEQTRRNSVNTEWTDAPIVAGQTLPRKIHVDELRASTLLIRDPVIYESHSCPANQDTCVCEAHVILTAKQAGGGSDTYCVFCQDYCTANVLGYCPTDASSEISWTDPTIVADETKVRAVHDNELMEQINIQSAQCVCEAERCNYCADCGHSYQQWYSYCSHAGCACDDHKYGECSHVTLWTYYWVNNCATLDDPSMDFDVALGNNIPPGIDAGDEVPWNCMCGFTPPGINWSGAKAAWGCMCNPFVWQG